MQKRDEAMSSSVTGTPSSGDENVSTDEIQVEIEHTRDEMSETINAIQDKLNPEVLKEHAKEVVRDATVGRAQEAVSSVTETAKDMVSNAGDTAKEAAMDFVHNPGQTASRAGSSVVDQVRANPVPFALAGAGLGLLYMRRSSGQNKTQPYYYYPGSPRGQEQRMSQYRPQTNMFQDQQSQQDSQGAMGQVGHMASNAGSSIVDVVKQNPVPAALAGGTLAWFLMNRSGGSSQGQSRSQSQSQQYYYQPGGYQQSGYQQGGEHTHAQYPSGSQSATRTQYPEGTRYPYAAQVGAETDYVSGARPRTDLFQEDYSQRSGSESEGQGVTGAISSAASNVAGTASQVGQTVGHTTVSAGSSVVDVVKQNPIPAALTGIGIGWMLMNRSSGKQGGTQPYYYQPGSNSGQSQYSSYGQGSQGSQGSQESEGGAMSAVTGTLSGAAGTVTDTLSGAAGSVSDTASQVGQQAREQFSNLGDTAQNQTQRITGWYDQMLYESPLTLAALAIGAGLAVGMSIPETQKENQLLGETRDNLMDKAQNVAQNTVEKVQAVAQEVGSVAQDAAKDAAQEVASTAKDSAQQQGLPS